MPFAAKIRPNSHLFDELGFDSILLLDLIVDIEERLGVRFSEAELDMESLTTPEAIVRMIASHNPVQSKSSQA